MRNLRNEQSLAAREATDLERAGELPGFWPRECSGFCLFQLRNGMILKATRRRGARYVRSSNH